AAGEGVEFFPGAALHADPSTVGEFQQCFPGVVEENGFHLGARRAQGLFDGAWTEDQSIHRARLLPSMANWISPQIPWAATAGDGARVIGRPTTSRSAPLVMAEAGLAVRRWSSPVSAAPVGR